jgi:CRP/FNR family transcriptional regulator, cyclic AMP receptor protein
MLAARRLEIVENCHERSLRARKNSGIVSSELVNGLATFAIPLYHPKGTVLFVEGQPSRGVFILCSGRVKLFTSSAAGKMLILRFAGPGEILGLAGTLSGQPYELWAEATQPTQTSFVKGEHFVDIIRRNAELAVHVAMHLGESYCSAIAGMRALELSRSATQKLAVFLLDWCENNRPFEASASAPCTLTREEIGHVIGISRETVTRLLSGFKKKGLIQWKGCSLVLTNRVALESLAAN